MTTRILGGKGNRTRRSQKASCRATTSRRPPTRYERSHTRKVNLCIIQVKTNLSYLCSLIAAALLWSSAAVRAQTPDTVFLEELTWTEVRDAIRGGTTTIILPTAGIEQNGPHMVLGKHKFIINHTSQKIARQLGKTLVAPVMTYVPEGDLDPSSSHMRFPAPSPCRTSTS